MFNKLQKAIVLGVSVFTIGLFQSASAEWEVNYGGISAGDDQDIVITLKSNPMANIEEACLSVTFARMLSGNSANNVTLFVTLDGVSLADKQDQAHKLMCTTPSSMSGEITLGDNLEAFLGNGGGKKDNMVVCPLCWGARYPGKKPDYGVLPGQDGVPGNAIGTMMGNADKILDF